MLHLLFNCLVNLPHEGSDKCSKCKSKCRSPDYMHMDILNIIYLVKNEHTPITPPLPQWGSETVKGKQSLLHYS